MKYSLAFVVYLVGSFALQCNARPQPQVDLPTSAPDVSSSSASGVEGESALTDVGTGTEASVSGDQVVFDESQSNQGDSDSAGTTTDVPSDDESQDVATTVNPCEGEDCPASSVLKIDEVVPQLPEENSGDASAAPAGDDSEAMNTTQAPSSE